MECTVDTRRREDGTICTSIFVFDKNAAGYASSAGEYMVELMRDAHDRLLCKGHGCETACPHCILSFDLRYQSRELDRHKGLEVLTPAWFTLLDLPSQARIFGASTATETMRLEESVLFISLLHPEATILMHLGPNSLWLPGDGDMLHLLDILRLRQVHVELTLEKEFYDSFSQEERMLLAPLIHGNVTCSVLEGDFSHPHARLAVTIEDGLLHRWAVYEEEENRLLLKGCTEGDAGTRRPLLQKDLQAKSGNSAIVQIGGNDKTSVTDFGPWLWHKLRQSLEKNLARSRCARRPSHASCFPTGTAIPPYHCPSLQTAESSERALRRGMDFPHLLRHARRPDSGEYSHVWDDWSRATERDEAVRGLLNELGTAKVVPMDKKNDGSCPLPSAGFSRRHGTDHLA